MIIIELSSIGYSLPLYPSLIENLLYISIIAFCVDYFSSLGLPNMSQLHAAKSVKLYYSSPKTLYQNYINKKWVERSNAYESSDSFIKRANLSWKNSNDAEKQSFMSAAPPAKKSKTQINFYFKTKSSSDLPARNPPSQPSVDPKPTSSSGSDEIQIVADTPSSYTINAASAITEREKFLTSQEFEMVKKFFASLKIDSEKLFTADIKNDQYLMQMFSATCHKWNIFYDLRNQYDTAQQINSRKSELKTKLENIDGALSQLKSIASDICIISCENLSKSTSVQISKTYLIKAELIQKLLAVLGILKERISELDLLNSLRRRIKQQNESINKNFIRNEGELLNFFCENNTSLEWSDVDDNLIDFFNSRTKIPGGIELDDLIEASKILRQNILTEESELNISTSPDLVRKIVKLMPVMYIKSNGKSLFFNLHEFVLTPGAIELVFLDDSITDDTDNIIEPDNDSTLSEQNQSRTGKGGQPSIVSKFPQIIDEITEFIKQNGFSAQNRRRTETAFSSGVTAKQIQGHLYNKYPDLKGHKISLATIRRLFNAPNKSYNAAERYKGLIDVRVGTKQNSYREHHIDAHYLFARNKMRRELGTLFSDSINTISVDDMAKLKVGAPAVSRYHQVKRYFAEGDSPNLPDHDFPVPGYLLNVSGHMKLAFGDYFNYESNYAPQSISLPVFNKMMFDGDEMDIFKVLTRQAEIQWKVKMSTGIYFTTGC